MSIEAARGLLSVLIARLGDHPECYLAKAALAEIARAPKAEPQEVLPIAGAKAINSRRKRATVILDDWTPCQETVLNYRQKGWDVRPHVTEFISWWLAKSVPMVNWEMTFVNHCERLILQGRMTRYESASSYVEISGGKRYRVYPDQNRRELLRDDENG